MTGQSHPAGASQAGRSPFPRTDIDSEQSQSLDKKTSWIGEKSTFIRVSKVISWLVIQYKWIWEVENYIHLPFDYRYLPSCPWHTKTPPLRNLCLESCHVYVPEWRPQQQCFLVQMPNIWNSLRLFVLSDIRSSTQGWTKNTVVEVSTPEH